MLLSLKLKMLMRNWLQNGTLIDTKNTVKQHRQSFMISPKPSKFYQIGIKDPTMMSYSPSSIRLKMPIPPLTASSMSMASSMSQKKNSSMSSIPTHSVTTTLSLAFQQLQVLMISRVHTENLPSSIILKITLTMKRPIKSSLRWMRPTMLFLMNSKRKIMTTLSLERLLLLELTISFKISSETDGLNSKIMISSPCSKTSGLKTWISSCLRRRTKMLPMKDRPSRHLPTGPIKMDNRLERQWLLRRQLRMEKPMKKQLKSTYSPMEIRI